MGAEAPVAMPSKLKPIPPCPAMVTASSGHRIPMSGLVASGTNALRPGDSATVLITFVQAGILPLTALLIPIHPLAFASFMTWQIADNVLKHTGYEIYPRWLMKTPLKFFLNTPTHHAMHHEKMRGNYGIYFNFWDRLMGTNHPHYEARFLEVTTRSDALNHSAMTKEES